MHLMPSVPESSASIVGLDPGTEMLGFAVITFNVNTLLIEETRAMTLRASLCQLNEWMASIHSHRFARLSTLGENILELLLFYQPIAVVCESPFFNSKRPLAFAALVEATNMIRQAVWNYDRSMQLDLIDPPNVKRAVNAKGNALKEEVQKAVLGLGELNYNSFPPLESLDEHSIDAIAVAYSRLMSYRKPLTF